METNVALLIGKLKKDFPDMKLWNPIKGDCNISDVSVLRNTIELNYCKDNICLGFDAYGRYRIGRDLYDNNDVYSDDIMLFPKDENSWEKYEKMYKTCNYFGYDISGNVVYVLSDGTGIYPSYMTCTPVEMTDNVTDEEINKFLNELVKNSVIPKVFYDLISEYTIGNLKIDFKYDNGDLIEIKFDMNEVEVVRNYKITEMNMLSSSEVTKDIETEFRSQMDQDIKDSYWESMSYCR